MYGFRLLAIILSVLVILTVITIMIIQHKHNGTLTKKDYRKFVSITTIPMILIIAFTIAGIEVPKNAENEYEQFIEIEEQTEAVYAMGDTITISIAILEANGWLRQAKESKEKYGCFSQYYYLDLENEDYIIITIAV